MSQSNDLVRQQLRRDDITHTADDSYADLINQAVVVEARLADNQANAARLQRLQNIEDGRALHYHLDARGVEADRARQSVVFLKQQEVLPQQGVLQGLIGRAHAVVDHLNED